MSQKENKNATASIQRISKPLFITAIAGAVLTLAATISSFVLNSQFLGQPASFLYYAQYSILFFGSFGVGYGLAKASAKKKNEDTNPIATGVIFALISFLFFYLVDASRLVLFPLLDTLPFPVPAILFNSQAIIAVALVTLFGLASLLKGKIVSVHTSWVRALLIAAFVVYQIVQLIAGAAIFSHAEFVGFDFFLMLLGLLISPLTIALITYFYIRKKTTKNIAAMIGVIGGTVYAAVTQLGWEFRQDPGEQSTFVFGYVVTIAALIAAATLVVAIRHSLSKR